MRPPAVAGHGKADPTGTGVFKAELNSAKKYTMKNPFMSLFLSGANKIAGATRAQATAAVNRELAKNAKQMSKAWTDALVPGTASPPKRKKARK